MCHQWFESFGCRTAASPQSHSHISHTCLIGFICVIVAWSQRGGLNYGPAAQNVCVSNCVLLCSYFICKIVLQSHIFLKFCSFFTPVQQFGHQHIQCPFLFNVLLQHWLCNCAIRHQTVLRVIICLKPFSLQPPYNVTLRAVKMLADLENLPLSSREMIGCSSLKKPIH